MGGGGRGGPIFRSGPSFTRVQYMGSSATLQILCLTIAQKWSTIVQNPWRASIEQYCMSNITARCLAMWILGFLAQCQESKECTLHARDCVMSSSCTYAMLCQQFIACTDSQEASLPVCYDQWWTSCVVGSISNHNIYFFSVLTRTFL